MSNTAKNIAIIFVLLALVALGNDIYVWQTSDGHPFAFAALGWIIKTHLLEEYQILVDTLGAETFNAVLTPVLKIPAFFLGLGLAALTTVIGFVNNKAKAINAPKDKSKRYK